MTLRESCDLLGVAVPSGAGQREALVVCPVCSPHRKKKTEPCLKLSFETGRFYCHHCQEGGGILDFWAFVLGFTGTRADRREQAKTAMRQRGEAIFDARRRCKVAESAPAGNACVMASLEIRNQTYRALLEECVLSEEHYAALRKRGLSEENIIHNQYRTYPKTGLAGIAATLQQKGCILKGVPGFHMDKRLESWRLRFMPPSILIPQRTSSGLIQGFQLRSDYATVALPKYMNLSSGGKEFGTSARDCYHITRPFTGDSLIITEGPLKADVASQFVRYPLLAVPGVANLSRLGIVLQQLVSCGLRKVYVAYDMDILRNIDVQKAMAKLLSLIDRYGLESSVLQWDPQYKGIDDFLVSKA